MTQIPVLNFKQEAPPKILGISIYLPKDPAYAEYNQKVLNTLQDMKANQLSRNTVKSAFHTLKRLNRETDLMNPEEVKLEIAEWEISKQSKQKHLNNYDYFCQTNQIYWEKPSLRWDAKVPITPSFKQAEEIIAAAPTMHAATIFRILLESGFEGQELRNTTRNDIDAEQGVITVAGTKGHSGRKHQFKQATTEMLRIYLNKYPDQQGHPFPPPKTMSESWRTAREAAASKTGNDELRKIPLKGLRNLSGILVYQKTKSPWIVMLHMGHKKLDTTQHYLQAMVMQAVEIEWSCKIASTSEQRIKLIEEGYTLVDKDGADWYFKIPKT
jgi:integrase